jgi:hypothetical protein
MLPGSRRRDFFFISHRVRNAFLDNIVQRNGKAKGSTGRSLLFLAIVAQDFYQRSQLVNVAGQRTLESTSAGLIGRPGTDTSKVGHIGGGRRALASRWRQDCRATHGNNFWRPGYFDRRLQNISIQKWRGQTGVFAFCTAMTH